MPMQWLQWYLIRAQTNTRIFGEYSNIWVFKYKISYSNIHFKGNIQHQYVFYTSDQVI